MQQRRPARLLPAHLLVEVATPARDWKPRAGACPAPVQPDRLFLRGIEAWGYHGVFDFERRNGQRFVVDVDWWLNTADTVTSDRLDQTLCYQGLFDAVQDIVGGEPVSLIETLCDRLVTGLHARFTRAVAIEVTVHKPEAPIRGTFLDVGVTMRRQNPGFLPPAD